MSGQQDPGERPFQEGGPWRPRPAPKPRNRDPAPPWLRVVLAVALVVGLVRLGGSVIAWQSCGATGGQALFAAVQGLGAKPSVLECLGAGLHQPTGTGDPTPATVPATEPPSHRPPHPWSPTRTAPRCCTQTATGRSTTRGMGQPTARTVAARPTTMPWWRAARLACRLSGPLGCWIPLPIAGLRQASPPR